MLRVEIYRPTRKPQHKLREINITQAITYPFLPRTFLNVLLVPGLILSGMHLLLSIVYQNISSDSQVYALWLFPVALAVFILGYGWRLVYVLRKDGYDVTISNWTVEGLITIFWDGSKLMMLIGVMALVSALPSFVIGLTKPEYKLDPSLQHWIDRPALTSAISEIDPSLRHWLNHGSVSELTKPESGIAQTTMPVLTIEELDRMTPEQREAYYSTLDQPSPMKAPAGRNPLYFQTPTQIASWIIFTILLAPFLFGAIVQSAENHSLLHLLNLRRALRAGMKCYGKSLLTLLMTCLLGTIVICLLNAAQNQDLLSARPENLSQFVYTVSAQFLCLSMLSISFHLIAQAFDAYKEDGLQTDSSGAATSG